MIKSLELTDPKSCLNRAHIYEMTFVLLSRDVAAPWTIRAWCVLRMLLRKNRWRDKQIQDALGCARRMKNQRGMYGQK